LSSPLIFSDLHKNWRPETGNEGEGEGSGVARGQVGARALGRRSWGHNSTLFAVILNVLLSRNLCRVYTCSFDNQVPNEKLVKSTFRLSSSHNILFVKKMESLLHTASKKFEF